MNKLEISEELSNSGTDPGDINDCMYAYCGPIAAHIERLEARIAELESVSEPVQLKILLERIEELEARPIPGAKVQAGSASIDTRDGLSVSDVIDLARALRDK